MIKKGDIVYHKSCSDNIIKMVVILVQPSYRYPWSRIPYNIYCTCRWMDDRGKIEEGTFLEGELQKCGKNSE